MKLHLKKLLLIVLYLFVTAGCETPQPPVRIGVNSWPPCEIWYVAQEKGFFGDTRVELVRFSAWTDNMKSLYAGKTDVTHATYFNALYYADKGEKGEIFLISDTIKGGDGLVVKNGIDHTGGLKGKKIAVEIGTDEHFLLHKSLEKLGLTTTDVVLVPSTSKEAMERFIAGSVDACFTYEPYLSQAAEQGNGKTVFTTRDYPGYMIDVLVGRSEVMRERDKDYKNIINAWYRAQAYIKENPEASFNLMSKNTGMTGRDFGLFYGSFTFFSLAENKNLFSSPSLGGKLDEISEFMVKSRLKIKKTAPSDVLYGKLVQDL